MESFVYIIDQETVETRRQINCPKEEYSVLDFSCVRFGLLEKVYCGLLKKIYCLKPIKRLHLFLLLISNPYTVSLSKPQS